MLNGIVKRLISSLALLLSGCSEVSPPRDGDKSSIATLSQSAPAASNSDAGQQVSSLLDTATCRDQLARVLAQPSLPGAPSLGANRAQILGRAKATPVLFVEEPVWGVAASPAAQLIIQQLSDEPSPRTLGRVYRMFYRQPELARAVLLRQGYLYTDEPSMAFALVQKVELTHLFEGEEIVIQRGGELIFARKRGDNYVYTSGASAGERAKVFLFDRVWASGREPGPALHVDLAPLAESMGFWRARLEHATRDSLVVNLLYGSQWVLTLLSRKGPDAKLKCELIEPQQRTQVLNARRLEKRRNLVLRAQRQAMVSMVQEALPFDEPRTEEGQQDGKLRPKWRGAYRLGESTYEFNGDTYYVFDSAGRPRVPQVCIDFITDTLERASGSWWQPRGLKRARTLGKLSFNSSFEIDNKRSVERFTDFAWRHPEQFDVYSLPDEERIQLRRGNEFFAHLEQHAARYRPGDIVSILGLKSDDKYHYHAFFVYRADPVSGMPIWLASNAGRPRLRSWYGEMLSAPRRSIRSRIRPRLEWLEAISEGTESLAREPTQTDESSG